MNAIANKLALAFGMLAMLCSCTATTKPSANTQQASQVTAVSSETAAIKIDGSSTVYPITQAIAKQFQEEKTKAILIW